MTLQLIFSYTLAMLGFQIPTLTDLILVFLTFIFYIALPILLIISLISRFILSKSINKNKGNKKVNLNATLVSLVIAFFLYIVIFIKLETNRLPLTIIYLIFNLTLFPLLLISLSFIDKMMRVKKHL